MFPLVKQLVKCFPPFSNRKSCVVTVWSGLLSIPTLPMTSSKTSVSALRVLVSTVTAGRPFLICSMKCFTHVFLVCTFTDFSDRISTSRRVGYESGDYELVSSFLRITVRRIPTEVYGLMSHPNFLFVPLQLGEGCGVKETPQQKYQRLVNEIQELSEEVEQIQVRVRYTQIHTYFLVTAKICFVTNTP